MTTPEELHQRRIGDPEYRATYEAQDYSLNSTDWIQTYHRKKPFWPLRPRVEDVDIIDIAHSLSQQCRYGGHTRRFYSVAEHSVLVSRAVSPENALWGLLHDATEAYLVDLPRPIKHLLPDYIAAENKLQKVIAQHFNLPEEIPEEVHHIDKWILTNERQALMGPTEPYEYLYDPNQWSKIPNVVIEGWRPNKAKKLFLERFKELTKENT